jgi:membrane protease YdiL (CAAX protease family)
MISQIKEHADMKVAGAVGLALLLFVAVNVPPIAAASLAHHFLHVSKTDVVPIVVGGMATMALLAICLFVFFGGMRFADFGFRASPLRYFIWALVLGIAFGVLSQLGANWMHDNDPAKMPGQSVMMIFFYVALFGPVEEEIVFRGLLQSILASRLRNTALSAQAGIVAVIVVSVLFMLLHFQLGLFTAAGAFVAGLALGEIRRRSESLLPGILCHIAINAAGIFVGS